MFMICVSPPQNIFNKSELCIKFLSCLSYPHLGERSCLVHPPSRVGLPGLKTMQQGANCHPCGGHNLPITQSIVCQLHMKNFHHPPHFLLHVDSKKKYLLSMQDSGHLGIKPGKRVRRDGVAVW